MVTDDGSRSMGIGKSDQFVLKRNLEEKSIGLGTGLNRSG